MDLKDVTSLSAYANAIGESHEALRVNHIKKNSFYNFFFSLAIFLRIPQVVISAFYFSFSLSFSFLPCHSPRGSHLSRSLGHTAYRLHPFLQEQLRDGAEPLRCRQM